MGEQSETQRLIIKVEGLISAKRYGEALQLIDQASQKVISTNRAFNAASQQVTNTLKTQISTTDQLTLTTKSLGGAIQSASVSVKRIGDTSTLAAQAIKETEQAVAKLQQQASGQAGVTQLGLQFRELTRFINLTQPATEKASAAFASLRQVVQRTGATSEQIIDTFRRIRQGETNLKDTTQRALVPALTRVSRVFRSASVEADKLRVSAAQTAQSFNRLQAVTSGLAGVQKLTDQFRTFAASANLTPAAITRVNSALSRLRGVIERTALTGPQIQKLFDDIRSGTVRTFTATEQLAVGPLRQLEAGFRQTGETGKKAAQSLSLSWQTFARAIMVSLVLRAVNAVRQALQNAVAEAADFQVKITEIRTLSQDNQLASAEWAKQLREVSDAFGIPILNVAEAAYQTLSNQIAKGAEAQQFLIEASRFSQAAVTDLTTAVNLLTGALNSFQLDAAETNRVSTALFKTIELGRIRASDMANTFGRTGVIARQLGIEIEELGALFASSTINGIRFNESQTLVRQLFLKLIKPTGAMLELLEQWGVSSGEAAIATFGLEGVLKKLGDELERGGISRIAELFGRVRAISAVTLFGRDGARQFSETLQKFIENTDTFSKAVGLRFESAGARLQKELNALKNFFIVDFGPAALEFIDTLVDVFGGAEGAIRSFTRTFQLVFSPLEFFFGEGTDAADKFAASLKRIADEFENVAIVQDQALSRTTAALRKELTARTRITLQAIAKQRSAFVEAQKAEERILESVNDTLEISIKGILDRGRNSIRELESIAREAEKRAEQARKRSLDTQTRFETEQFDLSVSEADVVKQVKLIQGQIRKTTQDTEQATIDFTSEDDVNRALRAFDEIEQRQKQLQKIRVDANKELVKNEEKLKNLRERFDRTREAGVERLRKLQRSEQQAAQDRDPQKAAEIGRRIEATAKAINDALDKSNEAQDKLVARNKVLKNLDLDRLRIQEDQNALLEDRLSFDRLLIAEAKKAQAEADKATAARRKAFLELQQNFKALLALDLDSILSRLSKEGTKATLENVNKAILEAGGKVLDNSIIQQEDNVGLVLKLLEQTEAKRISLLRKFAAQQSQEDAERRAIDTEKARRTGVQRLADQEKAVKAQQIIFNKSNILLRADIEQLSQLRQTQIGTAIELSKEALSVEPLLDLIDKLRAESVKAAERITTGEGSELIERPATIIREINAALIAIEKSGAFVEEFFKETILSTDLIAAQEQLGKINQNFEKLTTQTTKILSLATSINVFQTAMENLAKFTKLQDIRLPTEGFPIPATATGFARGGPVGGRGNGDTVPALLTPGEFVMNKASTAKFLPQLMAMNRRRFADGGPVPSSNSSLTVNTSIHTQPGQDLNPDAVARAVVRAIHQKKLRFR